MHPDLQALLGGGGPASADSGGGGLPPELMAAIHGVGSGTPDDPQGGGQDEVGLLGQIIDGIHAFLKVAVDESDKATIAKCLAQIQAILAKDQAEQDSAMQGQASPRLARKTAAAVGGPGGGY